MTHMIKFPYFFLEIIYFEILLQISFNYMNNEVVEYEINEIFDKKFEQYLIKWKKHSESKKFIRNFTYC